MKRTSLTRSQHHVIATIATHIVACDIVDLLVSKGHTDAKAKIAEDVEAMPDTDKAIIACFEQSILDTRHLLAQNFKEFADLAGESK